MSKYRSLIFRKIFIYRFSRREICAFLPQFFILFSKNFPENLQIWLELTWKKIFCTLRICYFCHRPSTNWENRGNIYQKFSGKVTNMVLVDRKTVREFSVDYEFDIVAVTVLEVTEKIEGICSRIFRKIFKYDTSWPKNDTIRWNIFYMFKKPRKISKDRSLIFQKIFIYRFSRREILHFCHNSSSCFPRIFLKIFKYGSNWPERKFFAR